MKIKFTLCLFLFIALYYTAEAQDYCSGQSTYHYYEGARLSAMRSFFVNDSIGFLVASDVSRRPGVNIPDTVVILKTTNKGRDWYFAGIINIRLANPAYDIRFADTLKGFMTIRHNTSYFSGGTVFGTYKTEDGGKNWTRFINATKLQIQDYFQNIAILNKSDSLYILTDQLLSLKIPNVRSIKVATILNDSTIFTLCETLSGISVQCIKIRGNTLFINDSLSVINDKKGNYGLCFKDESTGFFWNENTLYRKMGNMLSTLNPPVKIENINFVKDTIILSSNSEIYYSADKGENWTSHPYSGLSVPYSGYRDIYFLSMGNVFMNNPTRNLWIHDFSDEPIRLLEEPEDQTVRENCSAVFSVKGEDDLRYQWYFKDVILPNQTKASLVLPEINATHVGEYYCEVRNACNRRKTRIALLSLSPAVTIKKQPASVSVCLGDTLNLSVYADSVSYQWYKNGFSLANAVDSNLQIVVDREKIASYSCLLTDLVCGKSIFSDTINVSKKSDIGNILYPLEAKTLVCPRSELSLNIGNVDGALSYAWYKNDTNLGISVPTLTFSSISEKDTAIYTCRVKGNCSQRESSTLLVLAPPLKIRSYTDTLLHCANEYKMDTFFVEAENAVSYQWSKAENPEDAKLPQVSMLVHVTNLPNMYCTVQGYCEQIQTPPVYFALSPKLNPLKVPTICITDTALPVFISTSGSTNIIHFQWYRNDTLLKDDTSSGITIPKHSPLDIFRCEAFSLLCPSVSNSANIKYFPIPTIDRYPLDTILFACKNEIKILNGCFQNDFCYTSSYDTNGLLNVTRIASSGYGNCFFDRHKVKIMPEIEFKRPFYQYVSDFELMRNISTNNADLYLKEGYSYRWIYSLNDGKDWFTVPNSENKNTILPLKSKGNTLYKIETDFPVHCNSNIVQACWMNEYPKADSGWFLANEFPLPLLSMSFIDEKTGTLGCAEKGGLLTTTDGGRNWFEVDVVYESKHLKLDISHIISFGKNIIFSSPTSYTGFSNDYGRSWRFYILQRDTYGLICSPVSTTQLVATTGHSNGFIDISSGELLLDMCPLQCGPVARCIAAPPNYMEKKKGAITGGHHGITGQKSFNSCDYDWVFWAKYGSDRYNSAVFLNNDTVFVVMDKGKIMRSNKGGIKDSWKMVQLPTQADLMKIVFLNDSLGYIYGGNKLLKTTDRGETWQFEYTGIQDPIVDMQMLSEHSGYIITSTGKLYQKNTSILKAGNLRLKSPSSIQACKNETVRFTVECENATQYQWYKNNKILLGENQAFLELKASDSTSGKYMCVVSNAQNQLSSTPAVLSVFEIPQIQKQPQSVSCYEGKSFLLSIEGRMQESLQWYKEQTRLDGKNTPSLKINSAQLSDVGNYHCTLSNQCGSVQSKEVSVSVNRYEDAKAYIQESSLSRSQCIGDTIELHVIALNAQSYQWKFNGVSIEGATAYALSIIDLKASDLGEYTCEVKGFENTVLSDPCILSLYPSPILSFIGDTVFECETGGGISLGFDFSQALGYQWYKDGVSLDKTERYLELLNMGTNDNGLYQCLAWGYCGTSLYSPNIKISVLPKEEPSDSISILSQSGDTLVCPSASLSLFVNAPSATHFQWYKDGNFIAGATSQTLYIKKVESKASFYCIVSNTIDSTKSLYILVDVRPDLEITDHSPEKWEVYTGDSIELYVEATHASKYQWHFKGVPLKNHPDMYKNILHLNNIQRKEAGRYLCRVFEMCGHKDIEILIDVVDKKDSTNIEQGIVDKKISYYPNPVLDILYINNEGSIKKIELYNSFGYLMEVFLLDNQKTFEINVRNLNQAHYFLKIISSDDRMKIVKFIKI